MLFRSLSRGGIAILALVGVVGVFQVGGVGVGVASNDGLCVDSGGVGYNNILVRLAIFNKIFQFDPDVQFFAGFSSVLFVVVGAIGGVGHFTVVLVVLAANGDGHVVQTVKGQASVQLIVDDVSVILVAIHGGSFRGQLVAHGLTHSCVVGFNGGATFKDDLLQIHCLAFDRNIGRVYQLDEVLGVGFVFFTSQRVIFVFDQVITRGQLCKDHLFIDSRCRHKLVRQVGTDNFIEDVRRGRIVIVVQGNGHLGGIVYASQ